MTHFSEMGLPQSLLAALDKIGFALPTPIQKEAIPFALQGRDILASAQTGTGKTAAFMLPLLTRLMTDPKSTALILTPTRELATQIMSTARPLLQGSPIRTAVLIGGESIGKQFGQLRLQPRLVVGTPGRINDHLKRGSLNLANAHFIVLDETDRMLDMGFGVQIDQIVKFLPPVRQTLMFSATLPSSIVKMSARYLNNPERIAIGSTTTPMAKIKQETIRTSEGEKYALLTAQLYERAGSILVFVKTKHGADRLATKLYKENHTAEAIHGDLKQSKRDRVIRGFRDKEYRILVATDVAARGLDIPHIEHVINYDLPQCPEDYIHRIGRTGRAGADGSALNLITNADNDKWRAINRLINPGDKSSDEGYSSGRSRPSNNNRSRNGNGYRGNSSRSYSSRGRNEGRSEGRGEGRFNGRREGNREGSRSGGYNGGRHAA